MSASCLWDVGTGGSIRPGQREPGRRTIRAKRWKYAVQLHSVGWQWTEQRHSGGDIVYHEQFLYDLEADPHERNNLVNDPSLADIRAELAEILKSEMARAGEMVPVIEKAH